jgi:hypothetical protein
MHNFFCEKKPNFFGNLCNFRKKLPNVNQDTKIRPIWVTLLEKKPLPGNESAEKKRLVQILRKQQQQPNRDQGCQMACFETKNPTLGKFWRVLQWKMLVYFMDTGSILRTFVRYILWTLV